MLDAETLSRAFRALAHPRRAMIFRLLAAHPEAGDSFDILARALGLPPSTVTPHLREMERCGLVCRQRRGDRTAFELCTDDFIATLQATISLAERTRTGPLFEVA